jgi:hypothetical protein
LTDNNEFAIYALPSHSVQCALDGNIAMVERSVFDQLGVTEGLQDTFLTYDEVFSLLKPYAVLLSEGKNSVQSLQAQFANTPFERVIHRISDGDRTAQLLFALLDDFANTVGNEMVWVQNGRLERQVGYQKRTDNKYHMDWQGRAIAYRLAAKHIDQSLPIDDLDNLSVAFTSGIKQPNQFVLKQYRMYKIDDPFDPKGMHRLSIVHNQLRVCENDASGEWYEKDALSIVNVTECVPKFDGDDWVLSDKRAAFALLDRPALPGEYFSDTSSEEPPVLEKSHEIWAPLPSDLTLTGDLLFKA